MRGQIRGLDMAQKNAQDGISLIQTAEGALSETHDILQRMRELSVQSSNDTNTDSDRAELQKELDQLANAITDISKNTQFNEKDLLTGNFAGAGEGLTFHVGANAGQSLTVQINDMSAGKLEVADNYTVGANKEIPGLTHEGAVAAQEYTISTETDPGDTITVGVVTGTWQPADPDTAGDGADATVAGYFNGTDLILAADAELAVGATGTIAATEEGYYDDATGALVIEGAKLDEGTTVTVGINISDQKSADGAITTIQTAIDNVSAERSKLGAVQNRLDHTINNLGASSENLTAAESRIRDVDYAEAA